MYKPENATQEDSIVFRSNLSLYVPSAPWQQQLISDQTRETIEIVNSVVGCAATSLFGIVTNIINIIVFCRQGFSDAVNVSLVGLALADLFGLVSLLWLSVCSQPWLVKTGRLPFVPGDVQFMTAGVPRFCFSKIICWITIFITIQRCLCIVKPLTVKSTFTPRRTALVVGFLYLLVFFLTTFAASCSGTAKLTWNFYPGSNRTLLGLTVTSSWFAVQEISNIINNCLQLISFAVITLTTAILVIQLNRKTKWRQSTTATGVKNGDSLTKRDYKLSVMIIVLSTIQIISYLPSTAWVFLGLYLPGFTMLGSQVNLFYMIWALTFLLEALNSSVSIFVYYKMSSKYRSTCDQLCCLIEGSKTKLK